MKNCVNYEIGTIIVSDCCGSEPEESNGCSSDDIGICPNCLEHCEYIELEG